MAADRGPYLEFSRSEWAALRANTPLSLSESELRALRGADDHVALDEVAEVYLPMSRLLNLRFAAAQALHESTSAFLGTLAPRVPFVIGIAGSVAVGKSTTARVLQALLARWPSHPRVDLVTTDGFLFPNAQLEARGLMSRKGFPESYDVRRLIEFLADLKAGVPSLDVPVYSHVTYDVDGGNVQRIESPDIVIVEGINVLQVPPTREAADRVHVSDYFDFSIYVDGAEDDIRNWYVTRTFALRDKARVDPTSFFGFLVPLADDDVRAFAEMIWSTINGVNLRENIAPTRSRAHVVLEKDAAHAVRAVRLRRL